MYPYFRLFRILVKAKFGNSLDLEDESILKMRVLFGDMDIYPELNNGRHLTMMDMGRMDLAQRSGLLRIIHEQKWGFAVSGASVRYRHRLKAYMSFRLHTRIVAIDDRWFYFHQNTVQKGKTHSSALVRAGITCKQGLVPTKKVLDALDKPDWNPGVPEWVEAWSKAEELRPWDREIKNQK
jgi:acyl-CoA thioesterase FadM